MSRTTDKDVSIDTKVAESNKFGADVCMDIHINAGGGKGCEVYYQYKSSKCKQLARNIVEKFIAIGQGTHTADDPKDPDNGLKIKLNSTRTADYFGMVRRPNALSVLIECGYIDNKTDLAKFDTAVEQKKFGYAIADGVAKYLGLKLKNTSTSSASSSVSNKTNGGSFEVKTYKNGSTKEYVYETVADCKAQKSAKSIGYLNPKESCNCYGIIDGMYLVVYTAGSTKKTGFVKYSGGVK